MKPITLNTTKENFFDLQEENKISKTEIEIDKIILGSNIREDYNLESLKELQESIKENGQLQPVGISKANELIYGFRRYKAIKALGYKTIKIVYVDNSLSTSKVAIQIIENLQREDLNDYEYSKAIHELVKELKDKFPYPLTSKALGKKETWIHDRVNYSKELDRILKVDNSLSTSKVKSMSVNEYKEIASLNDTPKLSLIHEIVKSKSEGKDLTIKELRVKASIHKEKKTTKPKTKSSSESLNEEESKLRPIALKKLDKNEKLSHSEKKVLKSHFKSEIERREKEIAELRKEITDYKKKLGRVK